MLPQICAVGQHILHWWGDAFPPSLLSPTLSLNVALSLPSAHTLNAPISRTSRSGYFQCREEAVCIVCVDVLICMFVCWVQSWRWVQLICICVYVVEKHIESKEFSWPIGPIWETLRGIKNFSDHKRASHWPLWVNSKGEKTWRTVTIVPSTPESQVCHICAVNDRIFAVEWL